MRTSSSWAVTGVVTLVAFLALSSQLLFSSISPGPLELDESVLFNTSLACLLVSYARSCLTNPGVVPDGCISAQAAWCVKCDRAKPARAHHCRTCKRCIPKMDHHCPWTANCISNRTLPHFLRFLFYSVMSMILLEKYLFTRLAVLWENRQHPSYLGPSIFQLCHLVVLVGANSMTLFAMSILFISALWSLGTNTTTIESWEIERHEVLLKRARKNGGYLTGPNGVQVKIKPQEFPYDIGIWRNIWQGMGNKNVLSWFWPLSASLPMNSGLEFSVNGFEDEAMTWPPPDPDRMPVQRFDRAEFNNTPDYADRFEVEKFQLRQRRDQQRWRDSAPAQLATREDSYSSGSNDSDIRSDGPEEWKNSEGEGKQDYGVDEEADSFTSARGAPNSH